MMHKTRLIICLFLVIVATNESYAAATCQR